MYAQSFVTKKMCNGLRIKRAIQKYGHLWQVATGESYTILCGAFRLHHVYVALKSQINVKIQRKCKFMAFL